MAVDNLPNRYRPRKFSDMVGQGNVVEVLKKIALDSGWRPSALLITGPFGTGKTTSARLIARALLCDNKIDGYEPCGTCDSCRSMDLDNHSCCTEVDAASHGAVADVRVMKDVLAYRTTDKPQVIILDESHNLSHPAQNALLQILEEGRKEVLFIMCTTESKKMLPTIKSRCVELQMQLLSMPQIFARMKEVSDLEGFKYEEKALKIVASYVRGHARDALIMLEQLAKMADEITEDLVRKYLKLDRYVEVYELLIEEDRKAAWVKMEHLLCNYSAGELADAIGEVLINAYKLKLGLDEFTAVDKAWLQKVLNYRGISVLDTAEAIMSLDTDYATITYGMAMIGKVLFSDSESPVKVNGPVSGLRPGGSVPPSMPASQFRKPARPA